jgi:hypothetical protein
MYFVFLFLKFFWRQELLLEAETRFIVFILFVLFEFRIFIKDSLAQRKKSA